MRRCDRVPARQPSARHEVRAPPRGARGPARSSRRRWRGGCASDRRAKASRALRGARHFDLALCHWWPAQDHEPVAKRMNGPTVQRPRETATVLAAVAEAGCEPVDRQVYRTLRTHIGRACTIAAQELDLEVIERIEVRKAVADASRKRRIVVEQRRLLRDREEVRDRAGMLVADAAEDRVAYRLVGHELGVSRRDG